MKCLWQDIPDSTDNRGWRRVACIRCGKELSHTPHDHASIHRDCAGTPSWNEFGNWVEIILQVFGITKARWAWLLQEIACGCDERQKTLNTWGQRLRWVLTRAFWLFVHWIFRNRIDHKILSALANGPQTAAVVKDRLNLKAPATMVEIWLKDCARRGILATVVIDGETRFGLKESTDG